MVNYTCEICGFTVKDKSRFERHLNRKRPCKQIGQFITIEKNELPMAPKWLSNGSEKLPNCHKLPPKNIINQTPEHSCMYCGLMFNKKSNLTRHIRNNCKIVKSHLNELATENMELLDQNNELFLEKEKLKEKVDQLTEVLVNKPSVVYNTTNNNKIVNKNDNSITSTTNTHNTQNNTQNNIAINGYGNESIEHLNDQYFRNLIPFSHTAVPKLIKDIHCNPKVPENHNLKKTNKNDRFIEYFDGHDWKLEDKKKMLDSLVEMTFTILENTVDREDQLEKKHLDRFSDFRDKFYEDKDGVKTQHMNEAEVMIINNSKK